MTTFLIYRTDPTISSIDRSPINRPIAFQSPRSGSTDRPSISSIGIDDRLSISLIDRSPDQLSISSIGIDDRLSISSIYRSPDQLSISSIGIDDRLSISSISSIYRSAIYLLNRNRRSLINLLDLLDLPIGHLSPQSESTIAYQSPRSPRSTDRPSISSIGIDDRLSISSIGGRGFSILAYFSQSCLTRCDGRSDGSSVCQWTPTDRHSKRSYSIRPGCILKGVRIEEGYRTISQPIKATKPRGVLIPSRLSFVEMSPT